MPLLEEVFKVSGVPTYTFVPPQRYDALKVSIRTPGRCAVVEGPSGIGKTTSVVRIIEELNLHSSVASLSARKPSDIEFISALPDMKDIGIVIIDDFHRLDDTTKERISDFMKLLADTERADSKLVLIGINKAGDRLVEHGTDVGLRMDVFKLESNPSSSISQMIDLGETALNIQITHKSDIVEQSQGSFQIAQMLCHKICIEGGVTEKKTNAVAVDTSIEQVIDEVLVDLRRIYQKPIALFARGAKLRREGRAPYLHILKWLTSSSDWSLDLRQAIKANPEHRGSVGQVVEKGYLETIMSTNADVLDEFFHYQTETSVFSVEDPKIIFYLRNLNWKNFVKEVGYTTNYFQGNYDIALSFAGADRAIAERIFEELTRREVSVFYDKNEQHAILATRVEDYLGPIYRTEASYVVPLLSPSYPQKIWTKFESDQFKARFGQNAVIPIRFYSTADGYFSEATEYGSLSFDPAGNVDEQIEEIVETICKRLAEDRSRPEVLAD